MGVEEALKILQREDQKMRHVYREVELRELFGVSGDEFGDILASLIEEGILRNAALDVYEYRQSKHRGMNTLHMVARALRPNDIVYESLEYAASLYGIISQVPTVFTCMTTGEDGWYETIIGRIEFTHTDASAEEIYENTINRDEYYEIPFATEEYTEHDLRMLNRCVDLLEEQKIKTYGGVIGTVQYFPCADGEEQVQEKHRESSQDR